MKTDSLHNHIGFSAKWESVEESVTQMPKRILGKFCIHVKVFSLQVKMNLAVVKQLNQLQKKPEKFWGSNGIQTHDLRDTGAMLYQLSHEVLLEAGQVRV